MSLQRLAGDITQAIADKIGDPITIVVVALGFGIAACSVGLAVWGISRVVRATIAEVSVSRRWWAAAGMVAVIGYFGWQGLGFSTTSTPARGREPKLQQPAISPAPVRTAIVEKKDFPLHLTGLGTVQPTNIVTVRSRVDGQIEKVAFEEGQMVNEGDLLVQIDAAPFQAALNQAIAKHAQDQASLINAQQDLQRTTVLANQGNATQQLLDQRIALVAQLTAQIQADQATIESARIQLAYTTIRSPLTGRVGFRLVDRGNIVHANDQNGMLIITQLQPISVIFTAPEQQLPDISAALKSGPLSVTAFSSDAQKLLGEGTLSLIDNQVDTASGTVRLKASFNNDDKALWPGLSVATRLLVGTHRNAIVVPDTAVQRGPNGLFAYVVMKDNTAQMRPLNVARIEDGNALVVAGLSPGEQIVTSGHYRVQPGGPVMVLAPEQSSTNSQSTSGSQKD
jgi:membrane fusion protein, multidrug efflux system